jgi:hypothetical protein
MMVDPSQVLLFVVCGPRFHYMDGAEEHILIRVLHLGLFLQDCILDLHGRRTAGDRCEPLGSDGMWTKLDQDGGVSHR